jgi:hypothetical protein
LGKFLSPTSPSVLVAVDPYRVARLSDLPRFYSDSAAYLSQEEIEGLLKAVPAMLLCEAQELSDPPYEVGLVLRKCQLLVTQELGVTVQDRLQSFA